MDQISCQMATLGMSGECQVTFLLGHSDTNTYTTLGARGANMKTTGREEQDDCPAPQDDCRGVGGGWKGLPGLSSSFTLLWAMSSQRYRKLCPGLGMIEPEQLPRAHQLRPLECGVTDGLRHKQLDPQVTHTGLTEQHQRGHIPCPELRHHLNQPMMAHVATPACDTGNHNTKCGSTHPYPSSFEKCPRKEEPRRAMESATKRTAPGCQGADLSLSWNPDLCTDL